MWIHRVNKIRYITASGNCTILLCLAAFKIAFNASTWYKLRRLFYYVKTIQKLTLWPSINMQNIVGPRGRRCGIFYFPFENYRNLHVYFKEKKCWIKAVPIFGPQLKPCTFNKIYILPALYISSYCAGLCSSVHCYVPKMAEIQRQKTKDKCKTNWVKCSENQKKLFKG